MTAGCSHECVDLDFSTDYAEAGDWVCYRGTCCECGKRVEARYPLVEVVEVPNESAETAGEE